MNDREKIAWLHRRVGFGLGPGQLDAQAAKGVNAVLDELLEPDAHGVAVAKDPWDGVDVGADETDPNEARRHATQTIGAWLRAMATTPRPLQEWMRWFWHGHFVSTLPVVKVPALLVGQLRTFERLGLGDFRSLLRAVTVDPAMLIYLDGVKNKKGAVNENYGRELLELFSLGIGNYTEDDVRAGAEALTGWTVERATGTVRSNPRAHDDTSQRYLGRTGVHDVDTVVDAVVAHDACPVFITRKLATAILGPSVDAGLLKRLAAEFKASGLQIEPLVRSILEAGLDGASTPLITAPVPWYTTAIRATGAPVDQTLQSSGAALVPAGQVPLNAPNVAGWPGGRSWLTSSSTIARFNMAAAISSASPTDGPPMKAATVGDALSLADSLGHPEGFGTATTQALTSVRPKGAASVLTIALASPELMLA